MWSVWVTSSSYWGCVSFLAELLSVGRHRCGGVVLCVHGLDFFCLFGTCVPPLKIPLSAVGGGVGAVSQWGCDGTRSVACVLFF